MGRYFVRYAVAPGVVLPQDIRVENTASDAEKFVCVARTSYQPTQDGKERPVGLVFDVELDATGIEEAFGKGGSAAEFLCNVLAFAASVGLPGMRRVLALEISRTSGPHELVQYEYPPVPATSRRRVNAEDVGRLLQVYNTGEAGSGVWYRTLVQYRAATASIDPVEAFNEFWIGLETIDRLLRAKWNLNDKHAGVLRVFESEFEDGRERYAACRRLRNKYAHGDPRTPSMVKDALGHLETLRTVLIKSMEEVMGLAAPPRVREEFIPWWDPLVLIFVATLVTGDEGPFGAPGTVPHFEFDFHSLDSWLDGEQNKTELNMTHKLVAPPGVALSGLTVRIASRGMKGGSGTLTPGVLAPQPNGTMKVKPTGSPLVATADDGKSSHDSRTKSESE